VHEHFAPDDAPLRNVVPVSPLSVELESAPWPRRFNANTLPQYDGDYDPKEFLMKFEAAVESNGGDATTKAKALVLALKGEVQYWYANIPKGHITSWFQLRNKLLSSFKGMQVEELDSNDFVNMCVQGDHESLQEYMHRVVKLTARAPTVSESSIIDAIVGGLRVGTAKTCSIESSRSLCKSYLKLCKNTASPTKAAAEGSTGQMQQRSRNNRDSGTSRRGGKTSRRSKRTVRSTTCLRPPTRTRTRAAGTRADTSITGGRSHSSITSRSGPVVSGFSAGSMELMPSTTRISALRRSR
jgi:hypothetical protein